MVVKRHWLQFSLRGLLISTILFGVILGYWINSSKQQKKFVALVNSQKSVLIYEHEVPEDFDPFLNYFGDRIIHKPSLWDQVTEWFGEDAVFSLAVLRTNSPKVVESPLLKHGSSITHLYLGPTPISTSGHGFVYIPPDPIVINDLSKLGYLKNLETIEIERCDFTEIVSLPAFDKLHSVKLQVDSNFKASSLAKSKNLNDLNLTSSEDLDLEFIKELDKLKTLKITAKEIKSLKPLKSLKGLEQLTLIVKNANSISPLSHLPELKRLYLSTEDRIDSSELSGLIQIKDLHLNLNHPTDLSSLQDLENIEYLTLSSPKEEIYLNLSQLDKLQNLTLSGNKVDHNFNIHNYPPNVRSLTFNGTTFSIPKIPQELQSLEEITFNFAHFHDDITLKLPQQIRKLNFGWCHLESPKGLYINADLPNLEEFSIEDHYPRINEFFLHLTKWNHLKKLTYHEHINKETWSHIVQLSSIEELDVMNLPENSSVMKEMSNLETLRLLKITQASAITKNCKSLKKIHIREITEENLNFLLNELPDCEISFDEIIQVKE